MFKLLEKRLKALTIFDIFVSISIVVFVVFVVKFFQEKTGWKTIRVEIINKNWAENYNPYGYRTPFWLSDKLRIGQKEYNKTGQVIAEITNIENYERGSEEAQVYLTLRIKATYQKQLHQDLFKNKPLTLGSAIEIVPDQNTVYGQVVDLDVPPLGYPQKKMIVTARGRGIDQYIIDNIKINDTMDNRNNQTSIATIIDFHTENATRVFASEVSDTNKFVSFKTNPNTKDVVVKFELTANQIDNRWYFAGNQQIKVGNPLYFYGQSISLYNLEIEDVK